MRWAALVVVLGLGLAAAPSLSAEPDLAEFEQHLRAGVAAKEAGDLKKALYEFERAREFHDAPLLRYHVATTLAELGQCDAAEVQFRVVAEGDESDANLRSAARKGLQEVLDTCGRAEEPAIVIEEVGDGEVRANAEPPRRRGWRIAGWSMLGTGVVLGASTWLKWAAERSQIQDGYNVIGRDYGCAYDRGTNSFSGASCDELSMRADPRYDDFEDSLRSASRLNVGLGTTATVLVAGGVTTLVVLAFSNDHATVVLSPVGPSIGITLVW